MGSRSSSSQATRTEVSNEQTDVVDSIAVIGDDGALSLSQVGEGAIVAGESSEVSIELNQLDGGAVEDAIGLARDFGTVVLSHGADQRALVGQVLDYTAAEATAFRDDVLAAAAEDDEGIASDAAIYAAIGLAAVAIFMGAKR